MTTNHPDLTPPPAEPAPSLRPVEGRCGFTIIGRDGWEQPCERPATGWRWYQDCDHEDTLDVACDRHENEGGRRLRAAEETLAAVERLHFPYDCTAAGRKDHETCGQREWCYSCGEDQPWPCTTFQAIRAAALAEGASR